MPDDSVPKRVFGWVPPPAGDGKDCSYCARKMIAWTITHPTRDHVVPRSRGGTETVWCCHQCNQLKADMMPWDWAQFMKANPNWWLTYELPAAPRRFTAADCPALVACANALAEARYKHVYRRPGEPS